MSLKYNFGGIEGAASAVQGSARTVDGWFTGDGTDHADAGNKQIAELNTISDNIDQSGVRHDASTGDSGWMW